MNDIQDVLKQMRDRAINALVDEPLLFWTDAIEAAMREKDEAHRAAMRTCMEWRRKEKVEIEKLRTALERLTTDCMESDFNEHWDTFKNAEAVLAEKEDKT